MTELRVLPIITQAEAGQVSDFVAMGVYSSGRSQPVPGNVTVTWTSSDTAVATVANGTVTAVGKGIATITATTGGFTAKGQIAVGATTVGVQLSPVAQDGQVDVDSAFQLIALYDDHTKKDVTASATWAAHNKAVAESNGDGTFVGAGAGKTDVVGVYRDFISTVPAILTVVDVNVQSLAASAALSTIAKGTKTAVTATATYSDSSTGTVTGDATWASSDEATVKVSGGLAQGVAAGTATLTATYKFRDVTVTATKDITVTGAALTAIAITPDTIVRPLGVTSTFKATGTFDDATTQDVTQSVTWSLTLPKDGTTNVTIGTGSLASSGYRVSALKAFAGAGTVNAKSGDLAATASITIGATTATAVTYTVTAGAASIAVGGTTTLANAGLYTYDDTTLGTYTRAMASLTVWEPADASVVVVDNGTGATQSTVTGLKAGTTTISGYVGGALAGTVTITVTP